MKVGIWNLQFWKVTSNKAIRTFAQAAVAILTGNVTGIVAVDWVQLVSVAGLAALVCVFMCISQQPATESEAVADAAAQPSVADVNAVWLQSLLASATAAKTLPVAVAPVVQAPLVAVPTVATPEVSTPVEKPVETPAAPVTPANGLVYATPDLVNEGA